MIYASATPVWTLLSIIQQLWIFHKWCHPQCSLQFSSWLHICTMRLRWAIRHIYKVVHSYQVLGGCFCLGSAVPGRQQDSPQASVSHNLTEDSKLTKPDPESLAWNSDRTLDGDRHFHGALSSWITLCQWAVCLSDLMDRRHGKDMSFPPLRLMWSA